MGGGKRNVASVAERALRMVEQGPRVNLAIPRQPPGAKTKPQQVTKAHNMAGQGHKMAERAAAPPLGYIFGDWFTPWQRRFPGDPHLNKDVHVKREYPPLSLLELQRMIDTGLIDPSQPIDLATLCNTKRYDCDPLKRQFGVQLTAEGSDIFAARVSLEVQHADDEVIAAVERNGGRIVSGYFDPVSLLSLVDPAKAFRSGEPIPRRGFPPPDIVHRYTDAARRGYLANPESVAEQRRELGQRFGYEPHLHPDVARMPLKHPLQPESVAEQRRELGQRFGNSSEFPVFYGLEPGWVISLKDHAILKPLDAQVRAYYDGSAIQKAANN